MDVEIFMRLIITLACLSMLSGCNAAVLIQDVSVVSATDDSYELMVVTDQNVADYKDRICSYEPYLEYSVSGSTHEVTNGSKASVVEQPFISDFPLH